MEENPLLTDFEGTSEREPPLTPAAHFTGVLCLSSLRPTAGDFAC